MVPMGTKSREAIYGASVRAEEQAAEARKTADRLACEAWNKRMLGFQGPANLVRPSRACRHLKLPIEIRRGWNDPNLIWLKLACQLFPIRDLQRGTHNVSENPRKHTSVPKF